MRKLVPFTLVFCLLSSLAAGQIISGPVVEGRFEQAWLTENFDSISPAWPVVSNSENLLLIQNGEMVLQRRSATSPFAVFGSYEQKFSDFRLITSLKLGKAGPDGSLGLLFMTQNGGEGGFVFEINQHQQFRVRQITGSVFRFLSGDARTNGWVKNTLVKATEANILEVRSMNRKYDILLNNRYLLSFASMEYRQGGIGYMAGPATKGSVDFLYIFRSDPATGKSTVTLPDSLKDQDVVVLTESLLRLKAQNNQQLEENEELRQLLKVSRGENKDSKEEISELREDIATLQKSVAHLRQSNDSLLKVNTELAKFKQSTGSDTESDVMMTLSKSLKAAREKNDELLQENEILKEEIRKLKSPGSN